MCLAGPAVYVAFWIDPAVTTSAGLATSVFAGNWGLVGTHVPLDRLLYLAALASLGWRLMTGERSWHTRMTLVHYALLAATAYVVCSAAVADTLGTHVAFTAIIDRFGIASFILFTLAPAIFPTTRHRSYLLVGLVATAVYLGITAWAETTGLRSLVFPRFILDPTVGTHAGRARGPFLEASANGLALYLCAIGCYIALRTWRSATARWIAGVAAGLCLTGIVFTLTRQIWVGATIATATGLIATPQLRRLLVPVALGAAISVGASLALIPGLQSKAAERTDSQRPLWDRYNSNAAGLRMVAARPALGFGWGTYAREVQPYYRLAGSYPLTRVGSIHNVFLSNAVELGLLGTAIWLVAVLLAVGGGLRRRGPPGADQAWWTALLAAAVCWAVVANFVPLDYAFDNNVLWVLAGVAWASRHRRDQAPSGAPFPPSRLATA